VDFVVRKPPAALVNMIKPQARASILCPSKKETIMSSTPVESTTKLSKTQPQNLAPHSAQVAVCPSSTQTENETFVPLSISQQICAVALIECYLTEMIGGDTHYMAAVRAIDRAQTFGVSDEKARETIAGFMKFRKNPMPGFL
jgi:hypothetical protein